MAAKNVFAHDGAGEPTTLSELERVSGLVAPEEIFGCYAYATQSGAYAFSLKFQDEFWDNVPSRWLFGIDYGRTHPNALRYLIEKPNTQIRIHDGEWIVEREGFVPRRDYHLKAAIVSNYTDSKFGIVVGSGNFSSNGLHRSIEAGSSQVFETAESFEADAGQFASIAEHLWEAATPVDAILDHYEDRWSEVFSWSAKGLETEEHLAQYFWIEAGYVTQNRGPFRPGNQIDFPRGMNKYFGFDAPDNLPRNSIIGPVSMRTDVGDEVIRNLRLGNNSMEKMSLPIPETHGFDTYDGKVLVFEKVGQEFLLRALESADFDAAFGSRIANVQTMGSGRQYGIIAV
jgi:hypothetical protein